MKVANIHVVRVPGLGHGAETGPTGNEWKAKQD